MIPVLRFLFSFLIQNPSTFRINKNMEKWKQSTLQDVSDCNFFHSLVGNEALQPGSDGHDLMAERFKVQHQGSIRFSSRFCRWRVVFSVIGVSTIAGSIFFFIFFVLYQRFAVCRGDDNMFMVDSHSFLGFAVWRQCSQLPVEAFGNHCCILRSWYFPVMPFLRMFVLIPFWK